ncbi:hypothetical protein FA13DRAFT_1732520, partial [Coprinellus micaceus]
STTISNDEERVLQGQVPNTSSMKGVDERTPLLFENEGVKPLLEQGAGLPEAGPRRPIGTVSAIFIIFNRIIGTGIFATPSMILGLSGSVGLSLVMWLLGALIAAAGMQTYIIWGTKNYLEYLIPRPSRLHLVAYAAGNSLVFAEYTLEAVAQEVGDATDSLAGLHLQNVLGMFKVVILLIVASGRLADGVETPNNFESWTKLWEGSRSGATVVCACLYNVIWSYIGFSNANYALSEMKNPARTLRIAGPVAIIVVTVFYVAANEEITSSGRLVASLLFRNVWGPNTERVLSAFVALSALGNVLSVSFSQGRVNQALGKEDWPRRAPLAGLALHWTVCAIVVFGLPAGDAYNFVLNVVSYPLAVINATISFGLIFLTLGPSFFRLGCNTETGAILPPAHRESNTLVEFPAPTPSLLVPVATFGVANVFLFFFPLVKPPAGTEPYESLPYWTHAAGGWLVFALGTLYWYIAHHER